MKQKELKQVAQKIAKYEKILSESQDFNKRKQAEKAIMEISMSIHNFEDLDKIDELVQEILKKEF